MAESAKLRSIPRFPWPTWIPWNTLRPTKPESFSDTTCWSEEWKTKSIFRGNNSGNSQAHFIATPPDYEFYCCVKEVKSLFSRTSPFRWSSIKLSETFDVILYKQVSAPSLISVLQKEWCQKTARVLWFRNHHRGDFRLDVLEILENIKSERFLEFHITSVYISIFSRRFMKWNATIIVTFLNPHELTKIVLQSSTKFYGPKLNHLALRTEPKRFSSFSA